MGFCNNEFILISVSYSYYEVYTNTQRAFSGLGFTYGSDEDAAFITTWLEISGLDGIKLLKLKIELIVPSSECSPLHTGSIPNNLE